MAPEILSYKKYDAKADLWSTGAVLYECVMGKPPFRAQNHLELLKKIEKSGDVIRFSSDDSVLSAEFKQLIRSLLKKDPVERLSFEAFFRNSLVVGSFLPPPAPISPPSTVGIGLSPVRIPRRSDPGIRTQQSETPSSQNGTLFLPVQTLITFSFAGMAFHFCCCCCCTLAYSTSFQYISR